MKKIRFKRGLCLLLSVVLVLGTVRGINRYYTKQADAAVSVIYNPEKLGANVLPVDIRDNINFMNSYVYKEGGFNITSKFKAQSWKNVDGTMYTNQSLSTNRKYWHASNEKWEAKFLFDFSDNPVLRKIVPEAGYRAYLTSDYHWNFYNHKEEKWDVAKLNLGSVTLTSAKSDDGIGQLFEGRFRLKYYDEKLIWNMYQEGCKCGSTAVSGSVMYLTDVVSPRFEGAYIASDINGTEDAPGEFTLGAGDVKYIALKFSENIRFANNEPESLSLKLDVYDRKTMQKVTGESVEARLVNLTGNLMVFKLTVPATLNGEPTNVLIKGISVEQDWADKSSDEFPYVLIDENGKKYEVSSNISSNMKCSSKITDLAGNPVTIRDTSMWKYFSNQYYKPQSLYLDNVAPELRCIGVSGNMINRNSVIDRNDWPADIDRSSVFVGVGDRIEFYCDFSESINVSDLSKIKAVLNIKDKNGEQIKCDARNKSGYRIYFSGLVIDEGMKPLVYDGEPIKVIGIEGSQYITDYVGLHIRDLSTVTMKPLCQEYLDVLPPELTVSLGRDGDGKYIPVSTGGFTFTVPFSVKDNVDGTNEDYVSGTMGIMGQFNLNIGGKYPFQWYIDENAAIMDDVEWKSGWTDLSDAYEFVATDTQQYIHFKLDESVDYNYNGYYFEGSLELKVSDYAGNGVSKTYELRHDVDIVKPTLEFLDYKCTMNGDSQGGEITVRLRLADRFGIGDKLLIKYDGETREYALTKGATEEFVTFIVPIKLEQLDIGTKTVSVEFTDAKGNSSSMTFDCKYSFDKIGSDFSVLNKGSIDKPLLIDELSVLINKPKTVNFGYGDEATRTLMLIPLGTENINGEEKNTYLAFRTDLQDGEDVDIFAGLPNESNYGTVGFDYRYKRDCWFKLAGTITDDGKGQFEIVDKYQYGVSAEYKLYPKKCLENLYGKVDIIFVTSTEFETNKDTESPFDFGNVESGRILIEKESMYVAFKSEYSVEFLDVVNGEGVSVVDQLRVDIGDTVIDKSPLCNSFDDIFVKIRIVNEKERDGEALYGINQLVIEDCGYNIMYIENGTEKLAYSGDLQMASEQYLSLSLPETKQREACYRVNVLLKTKEGINHVKYEMEYYLYLDQRKTSLLLKKYDKVYVDNTTDEIIEAGNSITDSSVVKVGLADMPSDNFTVNPADNSEAHNRLIFNKSVYLPNNGYEVIRNWKVRVWSAMDPKGEINAKWYDIDENIGYELRKTTDFKEADYNAITDSNGNEIPVLPVVTGDNLIYYEIKMNDGEAKRNSSVLQVEDSVPEITVSEVYNKTTEVSLNVSVPDNIITYGGKIGDKNDQDPFYMSTIYENSLKPSYYKPTKGCFYVLDCYGNLGISNEYEITDVDGTVPLGVQTTHYDSEKGFHFTYYAYDDQNIEPGSIKVRANERYSAALMGKTFEEWQNDGAFLVEFMLPVNTEGDGIWESLDNSVYGIYRTKLTKNLTYDYGFYDGWKGFSVEIWGEFPYAEDFSEDNEYTIEFDAVDARGNSNDNSNMGYYLLYKTSNSEPSISINCITEDGIPVLKSDTALSYVMSYGAGEIIPEYDLDKISFSTTLPMICVDGYYEISFYDIFGKEYAKKIPVTVYQNEDIQISFSETAPTNRHVTVAVKAINEGDEITEITALCGSDKVIGVIDKNDRSRSSIEIEENGVITVKTLLGRTHNIRVINIDKVLEPAEIVFSYNGTNEPVFVEGKEDTIYSQVTAVVNCSENIAGINGKLSYTFPYGSKKGDSYIFQYMDMAGNTGEITAVLPYNIEKVTVDVPEIDEKSPEYEMNLLGMRNGINKYLADSKTGEDGTLLSLAAAEYRAQQYEIRLTITDDSKTKIFVTNPESADISSYDASGDNISGVNILGNSIVVKENSAFNIYIVDENNNVTQIKNFSFTTVDREAPNVRASYEPITTDKGYEGVRVWFEPEDDETIFSIDPGMTADTIISGEKSILRYYKDYDQNVSYVFRYKDIYGNIASVSIEVNALDTTSPIITSTAWYGIGKFDKPENVTIKYSNDIIALLKCSKAINSVILYEYDETASDKKGVVISEDTPVSVAVTGMNTTITFLDNVDRKLVAEITASGNGRKAIVVLPAITCIDKVAPEVSEQYEVNATRTEITYTFTTDEPTLFSGNSTSSELKTVHTWTVNSNKNYVLRFTDISGNTNNYSVNVTGIDDIPLKLKFSMDENGIGAKDNAQDFNLKDGDVIYVQANKDAVFSISGQTMEANAGQWTEISLVGYTGIYVLKAVDKVTNKETYENLMIQLKDFIVPEIKFEKTKIVLDENVTYEELETEINSGITIADNVDGVITEYQVYGTPDSVKPGYYTLTYTAVDSSGNEASANRTLYISYNNEPTIKINGEKAIPYGMAIIITNRVLVQVSDLEENIPIIMWKPGVKTTGQMKYGSKRIENGESFVADRPGFYTIYVRCKDRKEFVYYIYCDFNTNLQGGEQ